MPYLILRESYVTDSCVLDGLPVNEIRSVLSLVITGAGTSLTITETNGDSQLELSWSFVNNLRVWAFFPLILFLHHHFIFISKSGQILIINDMMTREKFTYKSRNGSG